jgi:hypothetical protein
MEHSPILSLVKQHIERDARHDVELTPTEDEMYMILQHALIEDPMQRHVVRTVESGHVGVLHVLDYSQAALERDLFGAVYEHFQLREAQDVPMGRYTVQDLLKEEINRREDVTPVRAMWLYTEREEHED